MEGREAMLTIKHLDHVVLRVTDLRAMMAFYTDVLGCSVEKVQEALGLYQLRAGSALIDLRADLIAAGLDVEQIARTLHKRRRAIGFRYTYNPRTKLYAHAPDISKTQLGSREGNSPRDQNIAYIKKCPLPQTSADHSFLLPL